MGKRPSPVDRSASNSELKRLRLSALLEKAGEYLTDFNPIEDHSSIERAIKMSERIVGERNLSKLYVGEGAVYFKDPLIIPEALVNYTKADRATIVASILFASVRPVDGDDGNYLDAFDKAVEFSKTLHPKDAYVDLPLILKNALEIRALDIPVISRPMRTLADLLTPPEGKEAKNNENFRRMIVGATQFKRALAIRLVQQSTKLSARDATLLNIKTDADREALLKEFYATMHYYIPLAVKLGQHKLKEELEDHILRLTDPVMHQKLHRYLAEYERQIKLPSDQQQSGKFSIIFDLCGQVREFIESQNLGVEVKVYGRRKTPYSTWIKMHKKGISFEELGKYIFDIIGITIEYDLAVHTGDKKAYRQENIKTGFDLFNLLPKILLQGRPMFKIIKQPRRKGVSPATIAQDDMVELRNYITHPKRNFYSAIHVRLQCLFTVAGIGMDSMPVIDLHIVSRQDQERNNFGTASHEGYKTSGGKSEHASMVTKWGGAAEEIIVSTPAGDYVRLNKKYCTAIHMARSIHCGLAAIAECALVKSRNPFKISYNQIATLQEPLNNGDMVKIKKGDVRLLFDEAHRAGVIKMLGPMRFAGRMNAFYKQLDEVSGLKL